MPLKALERQSDMYDTHSKMWGFAACLPCRGRRLDRPQRRPRSTRAGAALLYAAPGCAASTRNPNIRPLQRQAHPLVKGRLSLGNLFWVILTACTDGQLKCLSVGMLSRKSAGH